MNLSKYVTEEEFTRSQTATRFGINNQMNPEQRQAAIQLCCKVLDKIREYYKSPLIISSGFRIFPLNKKIGGAATSQHCKGEAADFYIVGIPIERLFNDIRTGKITGLVWDQVIEEGTWVHISYRVSGNRKQALRASFKGGKVSYTNV